MLRGVPIAFSIANARSSPSGSRARSLWCCWRSLQRRDRLLHAPGRALLHPGRVDDERGGITMRIYDFAVLWSGTSRGLAQSLRGQHAHGGMSVPPARTARRLETLVPVMVRNGYPGPSAARSPRRHQPSPPSSRHRSDGDLRIHRLGVHRGPLLGATCPGCSWRER